MVLDHGARRTTRTAERHPVQRTTDDDDGLRRRVERGVHPLSVVVDMDEDGGPPRSAVASPAVEIGGLIRVRPPSRLPSTDSRWTESQQDCLLANSLTFDVPAHGPKPLHPTVQSPGGFGHAQRAGVAHRDRSESRPQGAVGLRCAEVLRATAPEAGVYRNGDPASPPEAAASQAKLNRMRCSPGRQCRVYAGGRLRARANR